MDVYLIMNISRSASLRSLCFAFLIGATSSVPQLLVAETTPAPAVDAYTAAVNAYIDAATKEMALFRKEIESAEKQGKKEAYAGARALYEKCNALVAHLKTGGRSEFDPTKAEYERTRATLQKKLKEARHAQMAAPAPTPATTPAAPATTH